MVNLTAARRLWLSLLVALLMCGFVIGAQAASLEEAKRLISAGKMAEAASQLEAVVEATPDLLEAHFWLGRSRVELGDLDGAAAALETVLQTKPTSTESRYWLAEVRRRQGRLTEARGLLEQVLAENAAHPLARASLTGVEADLQSRQGLGSTAATGWLPATENDRIALSVVGLNVSPGETDIYSDRVYDYTFSESPTDWVPSGGTWEITSRWTCSPQWSWFGGIAERGLASVWNKRQFSGDVTVEVYAAFIMGAAEATRHYRNPNDMNITIHGDGANPASGYSFIYGGDLNHASRIMKGTRVLAESREREALLPVFEDGYPSTYEFHRRWWMLRVQKSGDRLRFWVDDTLVAEAVDEAPLESGRVAIWARDNGLIISRIKIYYENEQMPRDPMPTRHLAIRPEREAHPRHAALKSASHPAVYHDFETDLGGIAGRDGSQGAMVTLASPGADGAGRSAKLINTYAGGTFAADLHAGKFNLRDLPRLGFDYRLDANSKLNLYLNIDDTPCEIVFSGFNEPAGGRTLLGRLSGVRADGEWHRAEFDLLGHAQRLFGADAKLVASDLFVGNMNTRDYLDAGFGGNHAGATLSLDNFALYRPAGGELQVAAAATEGAQIAGWSIGLERDPTAALPQEVNSEDGSASFQPAGDGTWYVRAMPQLADGSWGSPATLEIVHDTTPPQVVGVEPSGDLLDSNGPIRLRVTDGRGIGVDPASIRLAVGERQLSIEDPAVSFDPGAEEISVDVALLGKTFPQGGAVQLRLLGLADRNGAALSGEKQWAFRVEPEATSGSPPLPEIAVGSVPVIRDDFETDTGEWGNWGAEGGAIVTRDPSTSNSGRYSLKLYNPVNGGSFGAYMRRTAFDAGRYRVVRFAYRIPEHLRADIMVHVNGARKSIRFTDNDSSYVRIGEVPNVRADNRWHTAEFNLYEMLRADDPHAPGYRVLQMWIADSGWTSNAQGLVYHIDDFELVPIVSAHEPLRIAWNLLDISGLAGVNWAITDSAGMQLPMEKATGADHIDYSESAQVDGWLHVRAVNSAGQWSETAHRRLLVDSTRPTAAPKSPDADVNAATSEVRLALADEGTAGVDPGSIVLHVGGADYTVSNSGLTYLSDRRELVWNCEQTSPEPTVFDDGREIEVRLKQAADYAGNPVTELPSWKWTMDYSKDTTPPVVAEIDCSTHRSFLAHSFEDDLDGWANRGGNDGAKVERDTTTAASGDASVKLTQQKEGGHMQALVTSRGFPADRFPVISFDYRFDEGLKLDMMVHMNGRWWTITMTGDADDAIGRVPGMRANGNWRHASVNLAQLLQRRQRRGPINVDAIIVGAQNNRDNPVGASASFDNFVVGNLGTAKPVFRWKATDTTGIAGYSYVLDQEPNTVPGEESMGTTAAKTFDSLGSGLWFFHVRALDGAGNWGPVSRYAIMHSAG